MAGHNPLLRESLDVSTAPRFRTGRACLDFVHTGGVGRYAAAELVRSPADAAHWLALVLDLGADDVHATAADLPPLRDLREAIWQLAQAAVADRPFGPDHVATVNEAATAPTPTEAMTATGQRRTVAPVQAGEALSALARDAIDLFTGPLGERVRRCAADDCELLFVDASRPGQRRWCSMNRCGSRDKMRRYRAS